jgi:hypothetical protein
MVISQKVVENKGNTKALYKLTGNLYVSHNNESYTENSIFMPFPTVQTLSQNSKQFSRYQPKRNTTIIFVNFQLYNVAYMIILRAALKRKNYTTK